MQFAKERFSGLGPEADYSSWAWAIRELKITHTWSFVRVAYIHNAGYTGGFAELMIALVMIIQNDTIRILYDASNSQRNIARLTGITLFEWPVFARSETVLFALCVWVGSSLRRPRKSRPASVLCRVAVPRNFED